MTESENTNRESSAHINSITTTVVVCVWLLQYHRIPLEVLPMAYIPVMKRLTGALGAKKVSLRMAQTKAGPTVTDSGVLLLL